MTTDEDDVSTVFQRKGYEKPRNNKGGSAKVNKNMAVSQSQRRRSLAMSAAAKQRTVQCCLGQTPRGSRIVIGVEVGEGREERGERRDLIDI